MIKYGDKVFWSPSGAAKAALGGPVNGWTFWRFRRNGEWVKLAELRKGGARRKTKTSGGQPIDTVVVPARAAGFEDVFLGEDRWYAVSIGKAKIPAIKYIAAYQVRPVSAITHYARVESIKPWKGGPKCVVRFKGPARKIGPISLVDNGRVPAPQGLRYTSWARLKQASNLDKVF